MASLLRNCAADSRCWLSVSGARGFLGQLLGGSSGCRLLRLVVAAVLLLAAAGKTYSLLVVEGQSYSSLPIPLWLVYANIGVEWLLGGWLLLGIYPHAAWLTSLGFGELSTLRAV